MKNQYGSLPDEFITGTIGDEGHHEGSTEINTSKEDIERLYTFISKVIVAAERHFERSIKLGEGNNIALPSKQTLYSPYSTIITILMYDDALVINMCFRHGYNC